MCARRPVKKNDQNKRLWWPQVRPAASSARRRQGPSLSPSRGRGRRRVGGLAVAWCVWCVMWCVYCVLCVGAPTSSIPTLGTCYSTALRINTALGRAGVQRLRAPIANRRTSPQSDLRCCNFAGWAIDPTGGKRP
ncbi:hypothetical protein GQ53DRAFT_525840 [Thozetella sp. PMI_491]|nr:hypothetical protein GQ53DRAFT_525840 [Thozetella sp. PMI_491]